MISKARLGVAIISTLSMAAACTKMTPESWSTSPADPVSLHASQGACEQVAAEWFKQKYYGGKYAIVDGEVVATYSLRNNAHGKSCTALVSGVIEVEVSAVEKTTRQWRSLFEIRMNKELGAFQEGQFSGPPDKCFVGSEDCKSLSEWDSLVQRL